MTACIHGRDRIDLEISDKIYGVEKMIEKNIYEPAEKKLGRGPAAKFPFLLGRIGSRQWDALQVTKV